MLNILKKIYLIQQDVDVMEKDGFNDYNKYPYLSETQITGKMKSLFDKHKVVLDFGWEVIETKEYHGSKGDLQFLVTVKVEYAFYDVDSGEKMGGTVYGQGADKGDKGIYKAITGAIKYLYMKKFNIPTGDDAEKDSPELTSAPKDAVAKPQTATTHADVPFENKKSQTCPVCKKQHTGPYPKCYSCYKNNGQ